MPMQHCQKANNHNILKIACEISSEKEPFRDGKKISIIGIFCQIGSNCKLRSDCSRISLGDGNKLAKQDVTASDVWCRDHVKKKTLLTNKKPPTHPARAEIGSSVKTKSVGGDPC